MNNFYKGGRELAYSEGLSHHAVQQKTTAIRQNLQIALQGSILAIFIMSINPIILLRKLWKSKAILLLGIALLHMFSLSAQTPRKDSGADGLTTVKPLKIGDTIPESLWKRQMAVVGHPEGKKEITLQDYRDKELVILDFWGTYCSSCIVAFPDLYSLEDKLDQQVKILSVAWQDANAVGKFIEKSEFLKTHQLDNRFYSIVGDKILNRYFQTDVLPFNVVIDKKGVVRALTIPEQLTPEKLSLMINDAEAMPIHARQIKIDKPLLATVYNTDQKNAYYSALLPYDPTIAHNIIRKMDTARQIKHLLYPNMALKILCAESIRYENRKKANLSFIPSRCILEMDYATDLIVKKWIYESVSPIGTPDSVLYKRMQADINFYTGVSASYQKRSIPCLILKVVDPKRLPNSTAKNTYTKFVINGIAQGDGTGDGRFNQLIDSETLKAKNFVRNCSIQQLLYAFNQTIGTNLPYMIDETGYKGTLDLIFPDDLNKIADMQAIFAKQGLSLRLEQRELDVFVITGTDFKKHDRSLTLTADGYIYQRKEIVR